jgi:redox-sensitive bicupin YhaK (pirin superfamily)
MGFGALRVLNDDVIEGGKGFGSHPHENMEIITIPLEGALAHKDDIGGEGVIKPGEVQVMSAGTGIVHSEYNHSKSQKGKFLQIWIDTKEQDIEPRYDQKKFTYKNNKFTQVAGGEKNSTSLYIHQDASISLGEFDKGKTSYSLKEGDGAYIFLISGKIEIENTILDERDAIGIWNSKKIEIKIIDNSRLLIIEVPMV